MKTKISIASILLLTAVVALMVAIPGSAQVEVNMGTLLEGELDDDGMIWNPDANAVLAHFWEAGGLYDLDKDGMVWNPDMNLVIGNFWATEPNEI